MHRTLKKEKKYVFTYFEQCVRTRLLHGIALQSKKVALVHPSSGWASVKKEEIPGAGLFAVELAVY